MAGLKPQYAAWSIIAGKLWDAVNDPLFGLLSDRIRSPHGRRRVLLMIGSLPLGLTFALMWFVPDLGQGGLAVFYALLFILFDTAYTAVHVGYNALTPELTRDYDERSTLNGYRMAISIAGSLGAIIFATVLGWYIDDLRQLYLLLGIGLGVLVLFPPIIVLRVTRGFRSTPESEPLPARQAARATVRSRPFQQVMGIYLASWTAASVMAAVLVYYANYYLRVPDQANYLVLAAQVSAILFVPVVVWLSKRFDKRQAFIIGCASWMLFLLALLPLQPQHLLPAYLLAALSGLGIATVYVIPWAMIPDIIEHDQLTTGQRREGSFYAFAAFFQKLGTGAAIWLMGQVLALSGYINPVHGQPLPLQPASAVLSIRLFISLVPATLVFISILIATRYSISRQAHHQMLEALDARS